MSHRSCLYHKKNPRFSHLHLVAREFCIWLLGKLPLTLFWNLTGNYFQIPFIWAIYYVSIMKRTWDLTICIWLLRSFASGYWGGCHGDSIFQNLKCGFEDLSNEPQLKSVNSVVAEIGGTWHDRTSWPRCHILLYIGGPFEQTICPRPALIATNSPPRGDVTWHDGTSSPKWHVYKTKFRHTAKCSSLKGHHTNSSMELVVIWGTLACSDLANSDLACSDLAHSDLAHFFYQNSCIFYSIFITWELI